MANKQDVKRYLAYWFQLGRKVIVSNGKAELLPQQVLQGDRYSEEFEDIWQQIHHQASECHLEGTDETIAELLTPAWEMLPCSRCEMPVPMRNVGMPALSCPCNTLPNWPNSELPQPRNPVSTQEQLQIIRDRLWKKVHSSSTVAD
ncbi:hypothetical protein HCG51_29575 [Tolypothrix sp. PCC 7910]|uniref:hypothetical protein n=1 Tax=Tolypothrix sp. PCC 7910 TaxID=2099387 RepID=UPI00142786C8|nr:hypothetical protein [Tolypothrix sp. PCC 7910]QIR40432.1 hypothetical protein HCG51_29575 [Tolypothrix sp. PCC 7910]